MIRNFITDLDGTLFDTRQANIEAYKSAFIDAGHSLPEEEYHTHFGLRFDALAERVAPHLTAAEKKYIQERKREHYKELFHLIKPNQPLITFLRSIRSTHKVGLATTASRENAENVINSFRLGELFDGCVFGEDVERGKPDPECYIKSIELIGGIPGETIIFEDSTIGIAAAEAAGAHVVRVKI